MLENPFAVLGGKVGATLAKVQATYRKLAKGCHPDRQPDDLEAGAKFRATTEARDTILEMKGRGGSARRSGTDALLPRPARPGRFGRSLRRQVRAKLGNGRAVSVSLRIDAAWTTLPPWSLPSGHHVPAFDAGTRT